MLNWETGRPEYSDWWPVDYMDFRGLYYMPRVTMRSGSVTTEGFEVSVTGDGRVVQKETVSITAIQRSVWPSFILRVPV